MEINTELAPSKNRLRSTSYAVRSNRGFLLVVVSFICWSSVGSAADTLIFSDDFSGTLEAWEPQEGKFALDNREWEAARILQSWLRIVHLRAGRPATRSDEYTNNFRLENRSRFLSRSISRLLLLLTGLLHSLEFPHRQGTHWRCGELAHRGCCSQHGDINPCESLALQTVGELLQRRGHD